MAIPHYQVDAFAGRAFQGNPAAVCLLEKAKSAKWMQNVAAENNLSETAFLVPAGKSTYKLRWFTPAVEVELCGHATLASAHVLWSEGLAPTDRELRFTAKSGVLTAAYTKGRVELDFPSRPSKKAGAALTAALEGAIGRKAKAVVASSEDVLVELPSEDAVRRLKPDFVALKKVKARGVIVTAKAKQRYDFISRFFGPAVGIDEDPVTGSAHCVLAPYWSEKLGKTRMKAFQASERGGEVGVELCGERVLLRGKGITVQRGELLV